MNFVLFKHVDIASLLIKHNTDVNATDRWLFTPLHEAAQKGRTQLCALLVSFLDVSSLKKNLTSLRSRQFGIPDPEHPGGATMIQQGFIINLFKIDDVGSGCPIV